MQIRKAVQADEVQLTMEDGQGEEDKKKPLFAASSVYAIARLSLQKGQRPCCSLKLGNGFWNSLKSCLFPNWVYFPYFWVWMQVCGFPFGAKHKGIYHSFKPGIPFWTGMHRKM